jgi:hypothetical protein
MGYGRIFGCVHCRGLSCNFRGKTGIPWRRFSVSVHSKWNYGKADFGCVHSGRLTGEFRAKKLRGMRRDEIARMTHAGGRFATHGLLSHTGKWGTMVCGFRAAAGIPGALLAYYCSMRPARSSPAKRRTDKRRFHLGRGSVCSFERVKAAHTPLGGSKTANQIDESSRGHLSRSAQRPL